MELLRKLTYLNPKKDRVSKFRHFYALTDEFGITQFIINKISIAQECLLKKNPQNGRELVEWL